MPPGAELTVEFRMESVVEGVLVTGTVTAPVAGECVRCLAALAWETKADFQELFAYPDILATLPGGVKDEAAEAEAVAEEILLLQDDLIDLEPLLRDAVVLSLPLQPVCRDDCPGLCPDCGVSLAGDPDHHHDDAVDIRWAALREFAEAVRPDGGPAQQEKAPRDSGDDPQEK